LRNLSSLVGAILALVVLTGCPPRCAKTCDKVLSCGLDSERVAVEECEASCGSQRDLYDRWEDDDKTKAFNDHRRCIMKSSCKEIADGACYDPDLFIFADE
jgi:hypothetical protein